jgi:hypothetical protein
MNGSCRRPAHPSSCAHKVGTRPSPSNRAAGRVPVRRVGGAQVAATRSLGQESGRWELRPWLHAHLSHPSPRREASPPLPEAQPTAASLAHSSGLGLNVDSPAPRQPYFT